MPVRACVDQDRRPAYLSHPDTALGRIYEYTAQPRRAYRRTPISSCPLVRLHLTVTCAGNLSLVERGRISDLKG